MDYSGETTCWPRRLVPRAGSDTIQPCLQCRVCFVCAPALPDPPVHTPCASPPSPSLPSLSVRPSRSPPWLLSEARHSMSIYGNNCLITSILLPCSLPSYSRKLELELSKVVQMNNELSNRLSQGTTRGTAASAARGSSGGADLGDADSNQHSRQQPGAGGGSGISGSGGGGGRGASKEAEMRMRYELRDAKVAPSLCPCMVIAAS